MKSGDVEDVRHADHLRDDLSGRDDQVRQAAEERQAAPKPPVYNADHRFSDDDRDEIRRTHAVEKADSAPAIDFDDISTGADKSEFTTPHSVRTRDRNARRQPDLEDA